MALFCVLPLLHSLSPPSQRHNESHSFTPTFSLNTLRARNKAHEKGNREENVSLSLSPPTNAGTVRRPQRERRRWRRDFIFRGSAGDALSWCAFLVRVPSIHVAAEIENQQSRELAQLFGQRTKAAGAEVELFEFFRDEIWAGIAVSRE